MAAVARRSQQPIYVTVEGPSGLAMAESDLILIGAGVLVVGVAGYVIYRLLSDKYAYTGGIDQWIANLFGWPYPGAENIPVPPTGPAPNLNPNVLDPTIHSDTPPWWAPTDVPLTPGQLGV